MKNKVIATLLFVPMLLISLVYSLTILYGSVSDADRLILDHEILNPIRINDTVDVKYRVFPDTYKKDVVIESSDPSIIEVIKPMDGKLDWKLKAHKIGEVSIKAYLKGKESNARDIVNFRSHTGVEDDIMVYDLNYSKNLIKKDNVYAQYDYDEEFNKVPAIFKIKCYDLSKSKDRVPLRNLSFKSSTNLDVVFDPKLEQYSVKINAPTDAVGESYIEFMSNREDSNAKERYEVKVIEDAVNVYNYSDLMHATNLNKNGGDIVVLRNDLESAKNSFTNYDIKNPDKLLDESKLINFRNSNLFGEISSNDNSSKYVMNDYLTLDTTYDSKFINYINDTYGKGSLEDKIRVGINLSKDLYGNGHTINMHSLTFPSGVSKDSDKINYYYEASDPFKGPLAFTTINYSLNPSGQADFNPVATIIGQDNVGLLINGDNINVSNVNIKSCNDVDELRHLKYVGTTVEIYGDNVTIKDSIIENGRNIIRSYSNMNLNIKNSLLRNGRDFIIKAGSNDIYRTRWLDDVPNWSEEESISNEITLDHVISANSGFCSIGLDSHLNGDYIIDGEDLYLVGANKLGATAKGTRLTLKNDVKMYDWQNYKSLVTEALIEISSDNNDDQEDLIDYNFNLPKIFKRYLVGENERFLYPVDEYKYDSNGNIIIDSSGRPVTSKETYVHCGIFLYGGAKNYSIIENSDKELLENYELDTLNDVAFDGLISKFVGNASANLYMYNKNSSITPYSKYNIDDLRNFEG